MEKHTVTIGFDQSLSNIAIYEHICLENINKLYKSNGNVMTNNSKRKLSKQK